MGKSAGMGDLNFNIVDIVILAILLVSALFAFVQGFTQEVLGTGSWIGAAIVTILLLPRVAPWLETHLQSHVAALLLGGGAIFLGTLVILWTLTHILSTRIQASAIGALDRTLGILVGLVKGAFYVSLLFIVMSWLLPGWTGRSWARDSRLMPLAAVSAGWISDAIANRARTEAKGLKPLLQDEGYGDAARQNLDRLIEKSTETK